MENRKKKILIVDDDRDIVESVRIVLESKDYEVLQAYNGKDGLNLAIKESPDVMLLDVMMAHETEGFEISREISKHPALRDMHVIMITSITKEMSLPFKFEPDEHSLPVDAILEKPVTPAALLKKIKHVLESAGVPEEEKTPPPGY